MKRKKGVGDRARIDQSILALGAHEIGKVAARVIALDDAVDHDMGDMDPLRAELARKTLCHGA